MALTDELAQLTGQPEGETLEYKAVLIPSRGMAQLLSSFANTTGGCLILGVSDGPSGRQIRGLSEDFKVTGMVHKALDLLHPRPVVEYTYFTVQGMSLFGIKVAQSGQPVFAEGKLFIRDGDRTVEKNRTVIQFTGSSYPRLAVISERFKKDQPGSTSARFKFLDHYLNVLKLYEDGQAKIFPAGVNVPSTVPDGRILNRILFSSCIDNFETYLSDLLYEIYLANPNTLKGGEATVRVSDVLDCADRDEFIKFYAGRKIRKLQKGSVKGFIKENKEIANLQAISDLDMEEIERTLQIRHLYAHRNGIVDESFLAYFPGAYPLNSEHVLSIEEVFNKLTFLTGVVQMTDTAAVKKYLLSTVS
jgi:Putative DNA-binding domain